MDGRDYQIDGTDQIRAAWKNGARSVCYVLPTGGGKSWLFNHAAATVARNHHTAVISVHRDELLRQNAKALDLQNVPYGIISAGYPPSYNQPVQLASVWTLARRLKMWPDFDLAVADECHHLPSQTFSSVFTAYPHAYRLGVTATPLRLDGIGLREWFDEMIVGPSMKQLQAAGYLAPCEIYSVPQQLDLAGLRTRGGDYALGELEREVDRPMIIGSAVEHYARLLAPRPAIAFGVTVKHLQHIVEKFTEAGYKAASIDGTMDKDARADLVAALGDGRLNVLASCEVLGEGVDVPICAGAIMLRPTKSLTLYLQQAGRAMRPKPGPDGLLGPGGTHRGEPMVLVDHVDNLHHGRPEADRKWTLDGLRSDEVDREQRLRTCKACFFVFAPHLAACPKCGAEVPRHERVITEAEGQLVRVAEDYVPSTGNPALRSLDEAFRSIGSSWDSQERARLGKIALEKGLPPDWVNRIMNRNRTRRRA